MSLSRHFAVTGEGTSRLMGLRPPNTGQKTPHESMPVPRNTQATRKERAPSHQPVRTASRVHSQSRSTPHSPAIGHASENRGSRQDKQDNTIKLAVSTMQAHSRDSRMKPPIRQSPLTVPPMPSVGSRSMSSLQVGHDSGQDAASSSSSSAFNGKVLSEGMRGKVEDRGGRKPP